jgi:hypothetical protein
VPNLLLQASGPFSGESIEISSDARLNLYFSGIAWKSIKMKLVRISIFVLVNYKWKECSE